MKRVRRPHGLLPKVPEKGAHITVRYGHEAVVQARVRKASGGREIQWRGLLSTLLPAIVSTARAYRVGGNVRRRDEGLTWARGWGTPEACALRVTVALS